MPELLQSILVWMLIVVILLSILLTVVDNRSVAQRKRKR